MEAVTLARDAFKQSADDLSLQLAQQTQGSTQAARDAQERHKALEVEYNKLTEDRDGLQVILASEQDTMTSVLLGNGLFGEVVVGKIDFFFGWKLL